jgi:hypothetical protein
MMATRFASTSRTTLQSVSMRPRIQRVKVQSYIGLEETWSRSFFLPAKQRTVDVRREGIRLEEFDHNVKGGQKATLWQSWLNLSPSTRMTYGICLAGEDDVGFGWQNRRGGKF